MSPKAPDFLPPGPVFQMFDRYLASITKLSPSFLALRTHAYSLTKEDKKQRKTPQFAMKIIHKSRAKVERVVLPNVPTILYHIYKFLSPYDGVYHAAIVTLCRSTDVAIKMIEQSDGLLNLTLDFDTGIDVDGVLNV